MEQDSYTIILEKYCYIGDLVQIGIVMKMFDILKYILLPSFYLCRIQQDHGQ